LIRPPARAPPNASSVSESQCLTLFSADIKLWIPQKASSDMKNANEGIGGAACNENHTFPGTPLSLVLCATAPTICPTTHNMGPLHSGFRSRETSPACSRWLEVQDDELSSHYGPETASMCRLALPFSYPVRRQACMHTNQPTFLGWRKRKMSSKVKKAAHLAFPDSRFYLGQRKNRKCDGSSSCAGTVP
jgi:hypothetical protein